jgi:hypothetical protein
MDSKENKQKFQTLCGAFKLYVGGKVDQFVNYCTFSACANVIIRETIYYYYY